MEIVNLTPHEVTLVEEGGRRLRIPASGTVARLAITLDTDERYGHVTVADAHLGEVDGLPPPRDGCLLLTSMVVAMAATGIGRRDVVSPDTGADAIRDGAGQVAAVRRLVRPYVTPPATER
jgi:hypothetical protein